MNTYLKISTIAAMALAASITFATGSTGPNIPDVYDEPEAETEDMCQDPYMAIFCVIGDVLAFVGEEAGQWLIEEGYPYFESNIVRPVRDTIIRETERVMKQTERETKRVMKQTERETKRVVKQTEREAKRIVCQLFC